MSYRSLGIALVVACALVGARAATAGCGTCDKTVVENAANNESFSTLVAAVKAAGLAETLSGSGPFTVFAPTNAAFEKLPAGTVEKLLKPENKDQLVKVLTYHVVPGKVMAKDVVKLSKAKTVEGKITCYLKPTCGWSEGVRSVLRKHGLEWEEKDTINNPEHRAEMIERTGQMLQPCVEINGNMLADVSGDEVEAWMLANNVVSANDAEADAPTDQPCAHEMPQAQSMKFKN